MIRPDGTRCLIEYMPFENVTTQSGFVLSKDSLDAPQSIRARILAIGKDVENHQVEDVVLVSQFGPTEAKENPFDKTLIIAEEDILATIVPDKAS